MKTRYVARGEWVYDTAHIDPETMQVSGGVAIERVCWKCPTAEIAASVAARANELSERRVWRHLPESVPDGGGRSTPAARAGSRPDIEVFDADGQVIEYREDVARRLIDSLGGIDFTGIDDQ